LRGIITNERAKKANSSSLNTKSFETTAVSKSYDYVAVNPVNSKSPTHLGASEDDEIIDLTVQHQSRSSARSSDRNKFGKGSSIAAKLGAFRFSSSPNKQFKPSHKQFRTDLKSSEIKLMKVSTSHHEGVNDSVSSLSRTYQSETKNSRSSRSPTANGRNANRTVTALRDSNLGTKAFAKKAKNSKRDSSSIKGNGTLNESYRKIVRKLNIYMCVFPTIGFFGAFALLLNGLTILLENAAESSANNENEEEGTVREEADASSTEYRPISDLGFYILILAIFLFQYYARVKLDFKNWRKNR